MPYDFHAEPGFVRATVAAVRLRVDSQTVHRFIQRGILKGKLVGARWFVDETDLNRLCCARESKDSAPPVAAHAS